MAQAASQVYHAVNLDRDRIALKVYDRFLKKHPDIYRDYSPYLKTQAIQGFNYSLLYLQEALALDDAAIFIDSVGWAYAMLHSLHMPKDGLSSSLEVFKEVLWEELPPDLRKKSDDFIEKSLAFLATAPTEIPPFIRDDNPLAPVAHAYLNALLSANRHTAITIINEQVKGGVTVRDIYLHIFQPVLREVGRLWQIQKISVAEEHYVTGATQMMLAQLYLPFMTENKSVKRRGKTLVAACVSEELHEVGIRMVADFFEMDGWDTYYIGANTPAPGLIAAVKERKADVVALSSTMSYHLPQVDYLIRSLRGDPDTRHAKIIIGGYPFNIIPDLWKKVGADAYAGSADEAVAVANRLTSGK
jgi:MerR family transcriptional regulator, light-induced transcriptional regulator